MFITASISFAPFAMAFLISYTLLRRVVAPKGKPMTVQTLTSDPASALDAVPTQHGKMQTLAKWRLALSSQRINTSSLVESGRSSVLSIIFANCCLLFMVETLFFLVSVVFRRAFWLFVFGFVL